MKMIKRIKENILFVGTMIAMLSIIAFSFFRLDLFKKVADALLAFFTEKFGWFYLLSMCLFVFFVVGIAVSRYGNICLGEDGERPEYSSKSWFAMLFCAGMGVGLVFWGVTEPIAHYLCPLEGMKPESSESAAFAFRTAFFHWGIHPWACYAVVGLVIAYFKFRKGKTALISATLTGMVRNKCILHLIDGIAIFATIAGIVTSLGLGVLQISAGLEFVFDVSTNLYVEVFVIFLITLVFVLSAVSGVSKGVKALSNVNLYLAFVLTTICFCVASRLDILNNMTNGIGDYLDNIFSDSLGIKAYGNNQWLFDWRIFYWAWWIAWAPFVGMFIARISKGRTIKEFVLGVVLVPTICSIIWFSVWGTLGISLSEHNVVSSSVLSEIVSSPETGLFKILSYYPLGAFISVLTIVLLICFLVTSADSGTYVLAVLTSHGDLNPSRIKKIVWGIVEAIFAIVLLIAGGLKPLQTISIVAAFPFIIIMILEMIALTKALRMEKNR